MNEKLIQFLQEIQAGNVSEDAVYALLDLYYAQVIYKMDASYDTGYIGFPAELQQRLEIRQSGIYEVLEALIAKGCDVNAGDGWNALMLAVGFADAPMTAWLLGHGADAHTWPDMAEPQGTIPQNYYLEDIDIHYMEASFEDEEMYRNALKRTAEVLVQSGGLKEFSGYSLQVDAAGNVTIKSPQQKY